MTRIIKVLTLGAAIALGSGMAAHAQQGQGESPRKPPMDSGMPQGMMNMMQQMSRMMENCNKMMESHMQHPDTQPPQQDHKD